MSDVITDGTLEFYPYIKTAVGAKKISAALAKGQPINLTHFAVGDGNGAEYVPEKDQTDLLNQCWSGKLNSVIIHPDDPHIVVLTGIVPNAVGGFFVREVAVHDEEGDPIYIFAYPTSYKPPSGSNISKDMILELWIIVEETAEIQLTADLNVVQATIYDLWQLEEKLLPEIGTVTLTNNQKYPFNNSGVTVALATVRDTLDYMVHTEVVGSEGEVGDVVVADKHTNGFRLKFTGSGIKAEIKYFVTGGLER